MTDPAQQRPSSRRKHAAMLAAAEEVFVRDGFERASMDEIAARAGTSKQTVYSHFGSKEGLFLEVVGTATTAAFEAAHLSRDAPSLEGGVEDYLRRYGRQQLDAVLDPGPLELRWLVVAESRRFPELAHAFWDGGPRRAVATFVTVFTRLHDEGLLHVPEPAAAARSFNWLLMGAPLNAVMLLGPGAVPAPGERDRLAAEAARVVTAAYATGPT